MPGTKPPDLIAALNLHPLVRRASLHTDSIHAVSAHPVLGGDGQGQLATMGQNNHINCMVSIALRPHFRIQQHQRPQNLRSPRLRHHKQGVD